MVRIAYEGLSKSSRTELEKKINISEDSKNHLDIDTNLYRKKIIKFVCYLSWCKVPKR